MKFTIDKKVALFIVGVTALLASVLGVFFVRNQARLLTSELDERSSVLLDNLSLNLEYPVLIRDRVAIARLADGVVAQKDVVSCRIIGKDGTLLYSRKSRTRGPATEYYHPVVARQNIDEESLVLGASATRTAEIGRVYLAVSRSRLNENILKSGRIIAVIVAVVIILTSLVTFLLLRRLVGVPVERLVEATERIAGGNLAYRVPITTTDEFAVLGGSFNTMTGSLLAAREELVRKEKLAMLGLLAGGVGNELRNPLGVMNNAVFFLQTVLSDTDGVVREYLDIIKQEIDNSQKILADFLDAVSTRPPRITSIPIQEFIPACLSKCPMPENIELRTELPEDLSRLKADPSQIEQVFLNLITNAVHAMPDGGTLTIRAQVIRGETGNWRNEELQEERGSRIEDRGTKKENLEPRTSSLEPDADFVEISVSDTGIGITPENMEKLFEPLFTTKSRGIGLGLTVSRSIVAANGGTIEVSSRLGEGTSVAVILQAEEGAA